MNEHNIKYSSNQTSELEQKVLEDVKAVFGQEYEYLSNVRVRFHSHEVSEIDIIIKYNHRFVCVVEVGSRLDKAHKSGLIRNMIACQTMYGILTDGSSYLFFNGYDDDEQNMPLANIKESIEGKGDNACADIINYKDFIDEVKTQADEILASLQDEKVIAQQAINNILNATAFLSGLPEDSFIVDEYSKQIQFATTEYEDKFFLSLIGECTDDTICRYTTVNSLFLTIKDARHNMCNINCMNDKGEATYADDYLCLGKIDDKIIIEQSNKAFILSCSNISNEDKLTMWRLYADDAKGVCLRYQMMENVKGANRFYLARVSYALSPGVHPELDFIKNISYKDTSNQKWTFRFTRWEIWKHFFKSYNYLDEKEIRLLYISPDSENDKNITTNWFQDNKSGIICEMKLFNYEYSPGGNYFPLKITHVFLGPKSQETEVNVKQIGYMLGKSKVYKTNDTYQMVNESTIKDYR